MNLLKRIIGLKVLALIDYCDKVDMGISGRKLAQLKALAEAFQEMPKAYYIRGTTYFASILVLFYTLLLSYAGLAIAFRTVTGGWGVIAGLVIFILLVVALSGAEKGRTLSLRLFLAVWSALCVCNLLVAGWLLFASFSWLSFGCWAGSLLLLWLTRQVMNGPELTKLIQWRASLRIAQYRRQALTQPRRK
ncbi:hypothetical protein SAMN03159434_10328 [Enterobacter sp. NFR05]|nr:hypothetical protein SAMN03159434_10328 [Enterobacter sp. NFR05]